MQKAYDIHGKYANTREKYEQKVLHYTIIRIIPLYYIGIFVVRRVYGKNGGMSSSTFFRMLLMCVFHRRRIVN